MVPLEADTAVWQVVVRVSMVALESAHGLVRGYRVRAGLGPRFRVTAQGYYSWVGLEGRLLKLCSVRIGARVAVWQYGSVIGAT